jgi:hypothetical protein
MKKAARWFGMTRRSLRTLLLRAARVLEQAAQKPQKPVRLLTLARELHDAAVKGIRA